ncbi:MAG TPA: choice-of-anchor X domain-containing protein, partial [Terriglobales bacterium]|nr:choice-of-anchor X domain-containing protein [Terriglobales bacterium]
MSSIRVFSIACLLAALGGLSARGDTITFEGLADLQPVDSFYAGVDFSNAVAHIAGLSLNDAELPPASGSTVALNDGGPITIAWASPISQFGGQFTYTASLTLQFMLNGVPVGTAISAFDNNLALSGDPGSSPNDPILFERAAGFDSVRIDSIGSYGVDDVKFNATIQAVPEPSTAWPLAMLLFAALTKWHFHKLARAVLALGIAGAIAGACTAASIDAVTISPATAPTGSAATVTVTAQISDPSVIASSVNLQQIDPQGRIAGVIGTMVDDGTNGDAAAGDRIFSIRFAVLQEQPGSLTYRVSAGVLGSLIWVFSNPVTFTTAGPATGIAIAQPANLTFVGVSPIIISGTVGDAGATVTVNGIAAAQDGGAFQVSVPLQEGNNTITAVAANSNSTDSAASIQVTLDTTAPHVTIDSPLSGATTIEETITVTGIVNDIVVGTVNGQQASVSVNGVAAEVANRHYMAKNVPLQAGENTLQLAARDQTGNSATLSAKITREALGPQFIKLVSGNNQSGAAGASLPAPLTVQLMNGGAPAPNVPVIFKVMENDAILQPGAGKPRLISINTDAQGQAKATLTLGHRSGAGNNTVQAYAAGFQGIAEFSASGTPGKAAKINVDSGNSQFGAVGQPLALPLVAVVSDEDHNRLADVPVSFSVKQGGGSFGGRPSVQVTTDGDGRALAALTLGPQPGQDNNVIEANFEGNQISAAAFAASAKAPGDPASTTISGVILDNSGNPIPGATVRLFRANQGSSNNQPVQIGVPVPTNAQGVFQISPAPVGLFKLMADGSTATQTGKSYPTLEYDIVTVAGQDNNVGMPIYLPALDPLSKVCVSPTTGGELRSASSPGFSLKVLAGSATFPGGSKTGCVSATPVNPDKIPMVPGFGQQPRFIVTIQPIGTIFSPPAAMTIPNVSALPPNSKPEMYSYDHDLASFVTVGSATVSPDGSVITSDPGVGVLKAGWQSGGLPLPLPDGSVRPVTVKILSLGPPALAVGDTVSLGAQGSPEGGTFSWKADDPGATTAVEIQGSSSDASVSLKAREPGRATATVRFTSNSADQNGVHPFAEASLDLTTYEIDSIKVTPSEDGHVIKPDRIATEVELPVEVNVTVNFGGVVQTPPVPVSLVYRFEDPDDSATRPGIDANGEAGNDNAPIARGGRRGAGSVMWKPSFGFFSNVAAGGQSAIALTSAAAADQGKSKITFLTSSIGGDNYIVKVQAVDSKGKVLKEATSGKVSVRKSLLFNNMYQMAGGSAILAVMAEAEIDPAFSQDGFTDYSLGSEFHNIPAGPGSPEFLVPIDPPTAAELPTQQESTDYLTGDPATKAAAKLAIEKKALAWHDRNDAVFGTALTSWINGNGVAGPAVAGIRFLHAKEDGDPATGKTNFYPLPGLEIAAGTLLVGGGHQLVHPDDEWGETLGLEQNPEKIAFIPLNAV